MKRELKFRAWNGMELVYDITVGRFGNFYVNPGDKKNGLDPKDSASLTPFNTKYPDSVPIMQYAGLKDKAGKEIYEGDIVKWVRMEIEYQTHYGDNIPLGQYTEPIGVIAKNELAVVEFTNGEFTVVGEEEEREGRAYNWLRYHDKKDRQEINYIFFPHYDSSRSQKYSDEDFIEQMNYVSEDLGIKPNTIEEFISMINGVEVIGNIYENPTLIQEA